MALSYNPKSKKPASMLALTHFNATVLLILVSIAVFLLLRFPPVPLNSSSCIGANAFGAKYFTGDLRDVDFSWNSLNLQDSSPPPIPLKIAVFSRKWPVATAPGGMERHAFTLHSALARRGHDVHVFTSAPSSSSSDMVVVAAAGSPQLHFLDVAVPGQWKSDEAWALFEAESERGAFDVVHSESVALFHREARHVPNLAVSWHGISLEALHSGIYQDLIRGPNEPMSPAFNRSLAQAIYKVLNEIRFFHSYAHHVAISDSSGEMLRDVYQIPTGRVHVILNGVDEAQFGPDQKLGTLFRADVGLPDNPRLVMGVAGRLVKDKGHQLLYEAFSKLAVRFPDVFLLVAGSGPWAQRYKDIGPNVKVLGPVPPANLAAYYNSLDLFVNPTLRPQGLDLTLMEAMQCGTPVAATRFPSIKGSIIVDDEFGFMFAPNVESLAEVLEKAVDEGAARLARRGRACREHAAAMFGARKMALAYERLFLCIKNQTYCKYPLEFN